MAIEQSSRRARNSRKGNAKITGKVEVIFYRGNGLAARVVFPNASEARNFLSEVLGLTEFIG